MNERRGVSSARGAPRVYGGLFFPEFHPSPSLSGRHSGSSGDLLWSGFSWSWIFVATQPSAPGFDGEQTCSEKSHLARPDRRAPWVRGFLDFTGAVDIPKVVLHGTVSLYQERNETPYGTTPYKSPQHYRPSLSTAVFLPPKEKAGNVWGCRTFVCSLATCTYGP